jgi:DNA-binding GntR family transcriptional regulator
MERFGTSSGSRPRATGGPAPILRHQVFDQLRAAIVDLDFEPGERLIERKLCEMMGVSRTSVREALRHLEAEGLITTVPHRGPVVTEVTPDEARDIYQVRAALEGLAGASCAMWATPDVVAALRESLVTMESASRRFDRRAIRETSVSFFEILFDGGRNNVCAAMIRSLQARINFLRSASFQARDRIEEFIAELRTIVDAVESRDPEAARAACARHVESAARYAFAWFEDSADRNNR